MLGISKGVGSAAVLAAAAVFLLTLLAAAGTSAAPHSAQPDPVGLAAFEPVYPTIPSSRAARETGPTNSAPNIDTGGPPAKVGRWVEGADGLIALPNFALHAVLMPTGKVLFWGYPPAPEGGSTPNSGRAAIWDPSLGTGSRSLKQVDPPKIDPDGPAGPQSSVPAPIYASGQSLLPSGDVLVAGGNLVWPEQYPNDDYTDTSGLQTAFTFDPFAERWVRQENMAEGRWHPSQVLLSDGRTAIVGGRTGAESPPGTPSSGNDRAETFTAARANGGDGSFAASGQGGEFLTSLNPHLFALPDDSVLMFGPGFWETSRYEFPPGGTATRAYGDDAPDGLSRYGGTAVLKPGGYGGSWTAVQLGGWDDSRPADENGVLLASDGTTEIDGETLDSTRGETTPIARSYANTVLLPDRSMVTVGGAAGRGGGFSSYYTGGDTNLKRVEVYDPDSDSWRLGPNQREYRTYHSVALLLPDGRVWSAGDDYYEVEPSGDGGVFKASTKDTGEIYEPPYLFQKGPRPAIKGVAEQLGYGDEFGVETKKGRGQTAVLMAPGAVTRSVDNQQRMVVLKKLAKVPGKGLNMKTPHDSGAAPPGYYMLFVLSSDGEPSRAEWVKLSGSADPGKSKPLKP